MSGFSDPLTITFLSPEEAGANRLVRLEHDLRYDDVCAPTGFISDGPSQPQILWNILPTWDIRWGPAGVIHDFLCCLIAMGKPHEKYPTRKHCDRLFARAIWDSGCGLWYFTVFYLGVCIGRWTNVRCTMVDYNIKLSAILEARVRQSTPRQILEASASSIGGASALPLLMNDHPHTFAALNADPTQIIRGAVAAAKQQASKA